MPEVICTVSNCKYHTEDNGCSAEKILVTVLGNLDKADKGAFTPAHTRAFTACQTFKRKEE